MEEMARMSGKDIHGWYNGSGPAVGSKVIVSSSGYDDSRVRKRASSVAKEAGMDPNDPLLLEVVRQNSPWLKNVGSYYDNNLMKAPPELNGGNTELIGLVTENIATLETERYLAKKGVGELATKIFKGLVGKAIGGAFSVLDPSPIGDGSMFGNMRSQNSVKIQKIKKILNKQ